MAQYRSGAVNVTNGNAVVTGVGTLWNSPPTPIKAGDLLSITGSLTVYEVLSVQSDTSLTLTETYKGLTDTNLRYSITRDFTPNNKFPYMTPGDDVAGILARLVRKLDSVIAPGATAPKGPQGNPGESSYLHIAYAADGIGTDFSLTPNEATRYIGFYVSSSSIQSTDWTEYTWALFVGNATINPGSQVQPSPTTDNMLWPDGDGMQWEDGDNMQWG